MDEITRREFLKTSGALVAGSTLGAIGLLPDSVEAANGGKSAQSAGDVISLPKGGGAIRGIGETFQPNLFTGTADFSVPIATSPGRGGFGPELTLKYSSGHGNGPFGLGWALSVPQVSRKTEKGLPRYTDEDTFLLSGAEDLVEHADRPPRDEGDFRVTTYRPRIEGLFARIEKWERIGGNSVSQLNDVFWKITTRDNVTNLYGRTSQAVLANPNKPGKVYQWLLELSYDTRGNYIHYEYKQEDGVGIPSTIYEQNRAHYQIYLKRIYYGNLTPLNYADANAVETLLTSPIADDEHFFTVVFDYGEHGEVDAEGNKRITSDVHQAGRAWNVRPDPFSSFRAGFELRTYRRCKRVLMFHNRIPNETAPVLVKSTDFHYRQNDDTLSSMLIGVTQRGYKKGTPTTGTFESEEIALGEPGVKSPDYEIKSIPRLDFGYTEFKPKEQRFKPFEARGGDMPPKGLNDPNFTLVDLFGTGLTDVLQTTPNGYYYWRNLGEGVFDRRNVLKNLPAGVTLDQDGVGFGDMAGDGQADLLVHAGNAWGFYEATNAGGWKTWRPYRSYPTFDLKDPNVRMLDLTGDGKADALRTDANAFVYFPCLGEEGFGEPKFIRRTHDLDEFPDVYFSDARVQLADMTGDGLKDIVMVHSGRIDYWPNLGYGHFGKRVTMKGAPHFGPDFDPRRLFLTDIDGDGPADMVYVESGTVRFWFNQCGNSWSEENRIHATPPVTDVDAVQLTDMFGCGCTGILWSHDYRRPGQSNYLFLDLSGGIKPYVLTETDNNMGATTKTVYKPSTSFYLEDLKAHKPWVSTIPFPVQVLAKVEVIDHIAKSKLVTEYTYHHGYYDGREREFRGFGRTEQRDTEFFDIYNDTKSSLHGGGFKTTDRNTHVPPILTKSWFHTGVYVEEEEHLNVFRREYYRGDSEAFLAHSTVEVGRRDKLSEARTPFEAYRALRGSVLRTEVYALDGTPAAEHPFTVTENGFRVKLLQHREDREHAVFYTTSRERFQFHYERNPVDPRISHQIVHQVDDYGNIEKSLNIVYPRRNPTQPEQARFYVTLDDASYLNQDDPAKPYFIGLNVEAKKIELNLSSLPNIPLRPEDVGGLNLNDPSHNLFSHVRSYYDGAEYQGLPLGQVGDRGLLTRSETLAFKTSQQIEAIYGNKVQSSDLVVAGYVESPVNSDLWWVQGVQTRYGDISQFFLPTAQKDAMGNVTLIEYDTFHLLPERTIAPLNTVIEAENDYRTLSPYLTFDPNQNRAQVKLDPLGMVTAMALMGKEGETDPEQMGDTLDNPTTRTEYDFHQYWRTTLGGATSPQPNYVRTKKREEHYAVNPNAREQESYTHFDGFGREIQTKIQAEPDPVTGNPRWVGSGWTVFNNKGWAIEKYEPFFSSTHAFEDEHRFGVSARMTYDPLGRIIRTDNPDGSFTRVSFDPWTQTTWDANDTVEWVDLDSNLNLQHSRWYIDKSTGTPQERDAAAKALAHKDTPLVAHLDTLGRNFLAVEDNGTFGKYEFRSAFDIQGNVTQVNDPRGNIVFMYQYDLLQHPLHQSQMDSGERTILLNAVGSPIKTWDSREHLVETRYDALNRPVELWVTHLGSNTRRLAERTVYGESQTNPESQNWRGQIYQRYDGAGMVSYETSDVNKKAYDFKGNAQYISQSVLDDYRTPVDWSTTPAPAFTNDSPFRFTKRYDALNRVTESTTHDGSRYVPTYNEANLLDKIDVHLRGAANPTPFVLNVDYNEKGQRKKIEYANGVTTEYAYDPNTFRLTSLRTHKNGQDLQRYQYTYDAVGNITTIEDHAAQTVYFRNAPVSPHRAYRYDPLYRLIEAKGREHGGQVLGFDHEDIPYINNIPHPNDAVALRRYTEIYQYDPAGNITEMRHQANGGSWTRGYRYRRHNNQLEQTTSGRSTQPDFTYHHDAHGNHIDFTHIQSIDWDFKDQMTSVELSGGGRAYYLYDSGGQRVRKVIENLNGVRQKERLYLGDTEIYREFSGNSVETQRETLHVMDDRQRVALVETLTRENNRDVPNPTSRFRYQFSDHLGSSALELDGQGSIISFEEYYPYGGTSYHSTESTSQVSQKRYRYSGKERDEETGLYYYGARYYVPWLGRWMNPDPAGMVEGSNLYRFVLNNPIVHRDRKGLNTEYEDISDHLRSTADEIEQTGWATGKKASGTSLDPLPRARNRTQTTPINARAKGDAGAAKARRHANKAGGYGVPQPGDEMAHMSAARHNELSAIPNDIANDPKNIKAMPARSKDATVFSPEGRQHVTDIHAAHEHLLDEIQARNQSGKTPGTLDSSIAAQDAMEEAKIKSEYMTREHFDEVKARGLAKPEPGPPVDPKTGKVIKAGEESAQKAVKKGVEEGAEKLAKQGLKKVMSWAPIGGLLAEIIFASPDASAAEIIARGVGGEIGLGPLDLTTAFDLALATGWEDEKYFYYPGERVNKETGRLEWGSGPKW